MCWSFQLDLIRMSLLWDVGVPWILCLLGLLLRVLLHTFLSVRRVLSKDSLGDGCLLSALAVSSYLWSAQCQVHHQDTPVHLELPFRNRDFDFKEV